MAFWILAEKAATTGTITRCRAFCKQGYGSAKMNNILLALKARAEKNPLTS